MKLAIIALSLALSAPAFAGQTYNCREIKSGVGPAAKSMLLTQIGNTPIVEGQPAYFNLKIADKGVIIVNARAVAMVEDVMFQFEVKGQNISGTIYLDELDQTSLTLGQKNFRFECK